MDRQRVKLGLQLQKTQDLVLFFTKIWRSQLKVIFKSSFTGLEMKTLVDSDKIVL